MSNCAMGGAEVQKSRLPGTCNVYHSYGCEFADARTKCSIQLLEINSNIQTCNPIIVATPFVIINPKKAWYGIFNT